jgi:type I restriction enzyme M protein
LTADQNLSALLWSVADLLRGDFKQSEYGRVILPFTVLRRFDCVLAPTRQAVWDRDASYPGETPPALLMAVADLPFYNVSKQTFATICADPKQVRKNLTDFINGFPEEVREIVDKFNFHVQIERLHDADLLYQVACRFRDVDLSPDRVTNHDMGYLFEELIRRFSELSNETAGEHFTPREVIELMVDLLLAPDDEALTGSGTVVDILDPACGTGGMLAAAEEHIKKLNPAARVNLFGQELNGESWAICKSDLLMKGYRKEDSKVVFGNSFSQDGYPDRKFRYMLANPPFGVEWKKVKDPVEKEHKEKGFAGRFGAGLPRINDGEDAPGGSRRGRQTQGLPDRDRLQRLPAVHRCGRLGRVRDPPLDHRARLPGGDRRASGPAVLQHRHQHVLLDRHQQQSGEEPREGRAAGRA